MDFWGLCTAVTVLMMLPELKAEHCTLFSPQTAWNKVFRWGLTRIVWEWIKTEDVCLVSLPLTDAKPHWKIINYLQLQPIWHGWLELIPGISGHVMSPELKAERCILNLINVDTNSLEDLLSFLDSVFLLCFGKHSLVSSFNRLEGRAVRD